MPSVCSPWRAVGDNGKDMGSALFAVPGASRGSESLGVLSRTAGAPLQGDSTLYTSDRHSASSSEQNGEIGHLSQRP